MNPQSTKTIKDGDSVTLSISTIQSESQSLYFKWKKDKEDIAGSASKYTGVDERTLKIWSFSAKEQGKYSCLVCNSRWSVESGSAELALGKPARIMH